MIIVLVIVIVVVFGCGLICVDSMVNSGWNCLLLVLNKCSSELFIILLVWCSLVFMSCLICVILVCMIVVKIVLFRLMFVIIVVGVFI